MESADGATTSSVILLDVRLRLPTDVDDGGEEEVHQHQHPSCIVIVADRR
jgi:hypothetical protein